MTYGHSEILEHNGTIETLNEMNIINRIHGLWKNYKKKNLLKSFDEVEPNVFVLKQEIADRIKLKAKKIGKRKLNKRN